MKVNRKRGGIVLVISLVLAMLLYVVLVLAAAPTHDTPILNSTYGTSSTNENITVYNQSTADGDTDDVKNIINWYRDGTSITVLNMPFEASGILNGTDYSQYQKNLSTVSGATWNATGGYDGKGAYEFDGVNNYLNVSDSASFYSFTDDFTISAWIKPNSFNFLAGIMGKYHLPASNGFVFRLNGASPYKKVEFMGSITSTELTADTWYFVTGVMDGGTAKIYLNGNLENSTSPSHVLNDANTDDLLIGVDYFAGARYFNGTIDEVMMFSEVITDQEIQALYDNRTDLIDSSMTAVGDVWNATITPNDGTIDGTTKWSNALTILANGAPVQGTPILNSSLSLNTSSENLTVYNISTADGDGNPVKNIINWYVDNTSFTALNMPFEADGDQNATDYSPYQNNGTNTNAVWNSTGGYDGKGAYEFDGGTSYISLPNSVIIPDASAKSICIRFRIANFLQWARLFMWDDGTNQAIIATGTNGRTIGGTLNDDTDNNDESAQILNEDQWYHTCFTFDGSTTTAYLDGTELSRTNDVGGWGVNTQGVFIGARVGSAYYFDGTIDDVLIFNHSLSPEQILALYNNRTDLIANQETSSGEAWNATITPNDGTEDGTTKWSNPLEIVVGPYPDCDGDTLDGTWTISDSQTITEDIECVAIDITASGTLTVDSITKGSQIVINATNITIASGGTITANSKGCPQSQSPSGGSCTSQDAGANYGEGQDGVGGNPAGGGGYGGRGGAGDTGRAGGFTYDSPLEPTLFGSGGGYCGDAACAGNSQGGGGIKLFVTDTFNQSGTITANGGIGTIRNGYSYASGGGSGGSIFVNTSSLIGTGSFSAIGGAGGDSSSTEAGGGSGGRIAIHYNTITGIDITSSSVAGGIGPDNAQDGDPGTLAFIDKTNNNLMIYQGWEFQADANYTNITVYDSLTRINASSVTINASNLISEGDFNMTCVNTGYDIEFNFLTDANFTDTAIKNLGNVGTDCDLVNLIASSNTQDYYTNLIIETNNNITLDFASNLTLDSSTLTLNNNQDWIILDYNPQLTLQSTTITANLDWSLANFTIDSGSSLSANIRGCPQSQSPSGGSCTSQDAGANYGEGQDGVGGNPAGGGGYGGRGGAGDTGRAGGFTYDSPLEPTLFGSGGGYCGDPICSGDSQGGGSIKLFVTDTFNQSGTITANGGVGTIRPGYAYASGGGSGGSIFVNTSSLTGDGSFSADGGAGGDSSSTEAGGGSGGRIAINYNTKTSTDITSSSVAGGIGPDDAEDGYLGTLIIVGSYETDYSPFNSTGLINNQTPVQLITNYSIISTSNQINRTITSTWTNVTMVWNDSASNSATVAYYNATGLKPSTNYTMSDNLVEHADSPSETDASGTLALFNVTLSSEHIVDIVELVYPNVTNITVYNSSWGIVNYSLALDSNVTFNVSIINGTRPLSDARLVIWEVNKNSAIFFNGSLTKVGDFYTIERNITSPLSTTVYYTVYANDTLNYTSEMDGSFTLTGPPVIRSVYAAEGGYLNGDMILQANVSDDNLMGVNFTIERADATVLAANHLGSNHTPNYWNATTVSLTDCIMHNYTVVAYDNSGYSTTSTGNITFACITLNLNPNPVNINTDTIVFGHINLTNGTDVTDNSVNIYFNGTSQGSEELGDGSDGSLTVSIADTIINNYTYLTGNEASGNLTIAVNDASEFAADDEILIIQMQNSSNGAAGQYEFVDISSISNNNITLTSALNGSYFSGTFNTTTSTVTQVVRVPEYTTVDVDTSASIVAPTWDGWSGGIIVFRATGAIIIDGAINVSERGYRGGMQAPSAGDYQYGYAGERTVGVSSARESSSNAISLGGGGAGKGADGSGGGGGYGTAGVNGGKHLGSSDYGRGAGNFGIANLSLIYFGGGGGGAGSHSSSRIGVAGGNGGGILMLYGLSIQNSGQIIAKGQKGSDGVAGGDANRGAGGGGGAGGTIYFFIEDINNSNGVINASGESGGIKHVGSSGYDGGDGGDGRIRLDFTTFNSTSEPLSGFNGTFDATIIRTNSTGDYTYNLTAPSTGGTYPVIVNLTSGNLFGQSTANLVVQQIPIINSVETNISAYEGASVYLIANMTDDNLVYVNFTVTDPDGVTVIDNVNGTKTGDLWNSSDFTLSKPGTYTYKVNATDGSGLTVSTSGSIDFVIVELSLSANPVMINADTIVSGHVNLTNTTNVTNTAISIYLNGTLQSQSGWFNINWPYRKQVDIESLVSENLINIIALVNFSTTSEISDSKMNANCSDIRFADVSGNELQYTFETSTCNSSNTIAWVWTNLTGDDNTTIYAYYGNGNADIKTDYTNLDDNLILYMHFDNSNEYGESGSLVYDFSKNGNNGTFAGNANVNDPGLYGNSLGLDGVGDYVTASDSGFPLGSSSRTISALVKWDGTTSRRMFIGYGSNANSQAYGYRIGNTGTGKVEFIGYNAGDGSTLFTMAANVWTHLVSTYDGTNVRTYVNGSLVSTQTLSLNTVSSSGFRVGWGYDNNAVTFPGYIDEVRVYDRTLNQSEILSIYNSTKPYFGTEEEATQTNLTADYSLNITAFSTPGTYPVVVNLTSGNLFGQSTANLVVQQSPIMNSVTTNTTAYIDQSIYLIADTTDDNLIEVNFTVTDPDGVVVIDNVNGTQTGDLWNSSAFTLSKPGTYTYEVNATDGSGLTDSSSGSIDFILVSLALNQSPVNINSNVTVFGHINLTNGTNVANTAFNTYLNGTLQTTVSSLGDGSDGDLTVSVANTIINNYTYLTGNESSGNLTIIVNDATAFAPGDEILIIQMQNLTNDTAGQYEFLTINSKNGNSITLTSALTNSYFSGTFNITNATTAQIVLIPRYTSVTINSGASITAEAWDGWSGGIVMFKSTGLVNITGDINVSQKGFRGGISRDSSGPEGYDGFFASGGGGGGGGGGGHDGSICTGGAGADGAQNGGSSCGSSNPGGNGITGGGGGGMGGGWRGPDGGATGGNGVTPGTGGNGGSTTGTNGANAAGGGGSGSNRDDAGGGGGGRAFDARENNAPSNLSVLQLGGGASQGAGGGGGGGEGDMRDPTGGGGGSKDGTGGAKGTDLDEDGNPGGNGTSGEAGGGLIFIYADELIIDGFIDSTGGTGGTGGNGGNGNVNGGGAGAGGGGGNGASGGSIYILADTLDIGTNKILLSGGAGGAGGSGATVSYIAGNGAAGSSGSNGTLRLDSVSLTGSTSYGFYNETASLSTGSTTNGTGDYSINITALSTPGTYPVVVNLTYGAFFGQSSTNLVVQQSPTINSVTTNTTAYLDQSIYLIADTTDENLIEVNFTITDPDGIDVIDNVNGTETGVLWNSSAFTLSKAGTYTYEVNATDADGFTDSSSGSIDFVIVGLSLSPNPVSINADTVVSGHVNLTNTTNVTNTVISIYLNGTLQMGSSWFDSNWPYRKSITILENSGSDLTDFQVNLTINTTELIGSGKLNANCSDIRFGDSNGNEIFYWIENESLCNTTSTKIWVKTNLTASINNTIYLYYGNTNGINQSNGSNVFEFFDDFNGGSIDSSKWTTGGGTISIVSGRAKIVPSTADPDTNAYIRSIDEVIQPNITIHYKIEQEANDQQYIGWSRETDPWNGTYWEMHYSNYNDNTVYYRSDATGYPGTSVGAIRYATNTDINLTIQDTVMNYSDSQGGTNDRSINSNIALPNNLVFFVRSVTIVGAAYIDDVYITKYVSSEPSVTSLGAEENTQTNSTADYSINITAFSTPGTYPVIVNLTSGNLFGQSSANLVVQQTPIINSVTINSTAYEGASIYLIANLTDENLIEVNFTVTDPDGVDVVDNVNGTQTGVLWNSSAFTLSKPGTYTYEINATDGSGLTTSTSGSIDFVIVELNLNPNPVNINSDTVVSGHVNLTNTTNVTNTIVNIYLNGTLQTTTSNVGDGSDGSLTVSTLDLVVNNYTYLTGNESSGNLTIIVNDSSAFSANDEILIIQIRNDSDGVVGDYEFVDIASINGVDLTLSNALTKSFYSGTIGTSSATITQVIRVPQYTTVTIDSGASITSPVWNGSIGGIVVFRATGLVNISGSIDVDATGYRGGSYTTSDTASTLYLTNGNGEGLSYGRVNPWAVCGDGCGRGGTGAGYATAGANSPRVNSLGVTYGYENLSLLYYGAGGGGGNNNGGVGPANGGAGGGIIYISADTINISGDISSNGGAGQNYNDGSGGGAAGGSIYLSANNLNISTDKISTTGGAAGDSVTDNNHDGGAGGKGRIRLDYTTLNGSVSSSYYGSYYNSTFEDSESDLLTNASGHYSYNITAPSTPGTYPILVNLTSGSLYGESTANLVVANITDDISINQTLVFSPASPAENQTVTINATVYGGTLNYTFVNVSLYIDSLYINTSVINLSPSETEYVLFNWNATPLNRTIMVALDANNTIYETNESNNNVTNNLWVTKVAVMEYIAIENGTHIIRGRTDATEEDPEDSVSNATTLQARIYNLFNSSEGVIGNCTFYFNNTLLGVNQTDTDGYCNYTFDHSIYTAGDKNLTVNFTDTNSSYSKHTENIEHNKTLIITVYETTLATGNTRFGNIYRNGDAAILYINTTKDGVLENVSNFTLEVRKSSPNAVLITQTYPGDIEILSTGQYKSTTIINATFVNTAIHWKIYVDDNQTINNTKQPTIIPATSGSHSDIDIQANNVVLNLSIVNESNTALQGSRIVLRDRNRNQLRNVPINNGHQRLVRPGYLNDNYQIKYSTDNGTIIDLNDVNASTTPFTLQPQVVLTYSGQRPENAQNLTTVIAINQSFNFTNATVSIPFNGLRPRGITYIYHCLDWDFSTAICNNWEENQTADYSDYSENATHFSFTVTSFTGYAGGVGYNANLTIDNNGPKTTDINITFNASYINNSNSAFITVADCNISFDDGTWALMTEMSNRYEHNKSFSTSGNHTYNITCNNFEFDTLNATDNVTVSADTGNPSVTLTSPVNNNFTSLNNITFACYANNTNLENISLYHNISQAYGINQTNNVSGADANTEFNLTNIPDGEYSWNCLAFDVSDNKAFATNNFTVTIDTITPNVSIGINDTTPEFSIDSVFIDWNASDTNLDTEYFNITYPNGTLLLNSTNSSVDVILTTTNMSVKGTYTINAFANDSASNSNTTNITFTVLNTLSTHGTPILNSTFGNNLTNENLTVYNISTSSPDSDNTKNIINWYKNGTSITILNMPFEADGDQNATDYSPFQNNGTVNNATWNSTGGYDGKGAFQMSENNYGVIINDDLSLNITDAITLVAWIKPNSVTTNMEIITKKSDSSNYGYRLQQNWGYLKFGWGNGTNSFSNRTGIIVADEWQHVAATYDEQTLTLYINGVAQMTETRTEQLANNNDNLLIGCYGNCNINTYAYNGTIDDVMVFNHSLSAQQIEALYNNRTDLIVSQETTTGDVWNATITPNDEVADGITKWSNSLTILADNPPTVTLISPQNQNFTSTNITFICNATDLNLNNITLYHNISQSFGANQSVNTSGTTDQAIFTVNNTADGNYTWNCLAYDIFGNSAFASANFSIIVDTIAPNVTAITPTNNFVWNTSSEVSFIFNVTDIFSNKTNCSLFINDTYYQGNDSITNVTNNYTQTLDSGNYTWFISCFDNSNNVQNSTIRNLTVGSLYGSLNVTWITPIANINVNHNEFFLMTVNVSCEGGDCGNVTITLDPEPINETEINNTEEINETIEINETTQTNNTTNTNATQTNETNNETIEEEDLDDITEEIDFEFFTLEDTYTLGETVYFYILPTNATYTINITPMSGTIQDLEFTPTQTGIYNITSTLEYNNQSELFNLTLTIIEPIEETETNQTNTQTYEEGENITQEDKHLGEKLEDEIHFETYFTNITQTNETLTITFYHDYIQSLPVWIEATEVQYTLSTTNAEPYENTTLEVTLIEGIIPRFNLHLGEESEVFEFGKVIPDVDIDHGETELIDRNDEKLDINITKNNNSINLEGVAEETDIYSYIEPSDNFPTDIIAVEPLDIEQATITLTTDTIITTIFECPDELFNYETLECLKWNQTNITFTQEDNQITFIVNHFSGYAGGNITNNQTSYLTIWDELDQGEPNTTNAKLLNQQTLFFANYLTTQNLTRITNGNCTLNFSNTLYPMTYNTTYTYYTANRTFTTAGTYTYTVTCTHSTYNNLTAQEDIRVPTNKGVVPTTPSTPFYTNGTNPQLCLNLNETNPCTMSWWVNATGTPGLSYEFYAYAISTSYPDDVDEVNSSFLNITIRSNETTEPIIITTNSTPIISYLGQNISLSATASDNTQVDSCYANITLPNSSIVQVNNTCIQQQIYTTTTLGRHNITFIVNDTSSNIITNTDNYFIVYAVLNFSTTMNSSNGSLNTHLQLIHSETQELVRQDDINGTYNQTIPDTIYDLLFSAYSTRLQIRLRQVNLSDETGNSFGLDKLSTPVTGYLLTYAIDTNYSFNNATVIIYYDDASFTNEARLRLYKCDNWDFNTQVCNGTWVDVTSNSTQNTPNDYFEYLTTSFSGFSIRQTSSSSGATGGSGGGGGGKVILPVNTTNTTKGNCTTDWQCADWEECKDNLRRRYCTDVNNCNSPVAAPHMIEECEITITNETTIQTPTQITTETQTPTQPEQEIITDTKKPLTDETKAAYKLLLIILVIWLIYEYYKPRPSKPPRQIKSKTLESKLKHIPKPETKQPELITSIQQKSKLHFKLPKLNLQIFKLHLPKIKLPKSLKQLKEWFYRF